MEKLPDIRAVQVQQQDGESHMLACVRRRCAGAVTHFHPYQCDTTAMCPRDHSSKAAVCFDTHLTPIQPTRPPPLRPAGDHDGGGAQRAAGAAPGQRALRLLLPPPLQRDHPHDHVRTHARLGFYALPRLSPPTLTTTTCVSMPCLSSLSHHSTHNLNPGTSPRTPRSAGPSSPRSSASAWATPSSPSSTSSWGPRG